VTGFPGSPRLLKGGLVLIDPDTSAVKRIIALQYNPDTITRTLQVQGVGPEPGDRSEVLRLKGPPVETLAHRTCCDRSPGRIAGLWSCGRFVCRRDIDSTRLKGANR
jgi:hypothetical protein